MRLCLVYKYPPIEGGEASKAYWLAKALGERGHEVHVVTNAMEVEGNYREHFDIDDLLHYQPPNVYVHSTDPFQEPMHIPYNRPYSEKLASYAIELIRRYDLQIIDSWYILPYGVSGFLAKTFTGKPQVLRHAGSDMSRLLLSPYLYTLFVEIFKRTEKIVTYSSMKSRFLELGVPEDRIFINSKVSVDTNSFNPDTTPDNIGLDGDQTGIPVITYIGKIGIHKGVFELVEALGMIKSDFRLLLVTGGRGVRRLKDAVSAHGLEEKTVYRGFVPPWRIPGIIKTSTCVVLAENNFPIKQHTPILPREVLAVGTCLVLSTELYEKRRSNKLLDQRNLIVVDPRKINDFRSRLEMIIDDPSYAANIGHEGFLVSRETEDFDGYVSSMEELYRELLDNS